MGCHFHLLIKKVGRTWRKVMWKNDCSTINVSETKMRFCAGISESSIFGLYGLKLLLTFLVSYVLFKLLTTMISFFHTNIGPHCTTPVHPHAFSRSKNIATICFLCKKVSLILVSSLINWSAGDRPFLKPHWYFVNILCFSK